MKHWKFLLPAAAILLATTGAGCAGMGGSSEGASTSAQGQVDAAVDAMENASTNETQATVTEDVNAQSATDTESLNNLGYTYDTNNF